MNKPFIFLLALLAFVHLGFTQEVIVGDELYQKEISPQRTSTFDFSERIQLNVVSGFGDKLELKTKYDTTSTSDFETETEATKLGTDSLSRTIFEDEEVMSKLNKTPRFGTIETRINRRLDSFHEEYAPVILSDDTVLIFSRRSPSDEEEYEDIYRFEKVDSGSSSISLPFFDDFSYDSIQPGCHLWEVSDTTRLPGISLGRAINPPTKGVLTFDGADNNGQPYECDEIGIGFQDSVVSRGIDLSALSTGSNVYLTFLYQQGGRSDKPESSDSLIVMFDTTGNNTFERVWAINGGASPDVFSHAVIPLDKSQYFNANFHFKILSKGSQNGELDCWHIDYVKMDQGRSDSDTLYTDASISWYDKAYFDDLYTAVPRDHVNSISTVDQSIVRVSNLRNSAYSRTVRMNISDPVGANAFGGTTTDNQTISFGASGTTNVTSATFTDQAFSGYGEVQLETYLDADGSDAHAANDTLVLHFPVDSVYAYDDGEVDVAYGLQASRGFAMRFDLPVADTVTGAWINFTPLIHVATGGAVTCMEDHGFKLTVWDHNGVANHPDTILFSQLGGMSVDWGDTINEFVRYEFGDTVLVGTTFYIGIIQTDDKPIGVGYDLNFNNNDKVYFQNSFNQWVNSSLNGTLMIRPEFAHKRDPVAIDQPFADERNTFRVFPNPTTGSFSIDWQGIEYMQDIEGKVFDMQGRVVSSFDFGETTLPKGIDPKTNLPSGMYIVSVSGTEPSGNKVSGHTRLVINK